MAHESSGVLSLTSAALHHGWEVPELPRLPHVLYPAQAEGPGAVPGLVQLHRGDLHPDTGRRHRDPRLQTLEQCLRPLPFDEALTVGDSALRHGDGSPALLKGVARSGTWARLEDGPSPWPRAARREAANPFESVSARDRPEVPGSSVEPQA